MCMQEYTLAKEVMCSCFCKEEILLSLSLYFDGIIDERMLCHLRIDVSALVNRLCSIHWHRLQEEARREKERKREREREIER